MTSFLRIEQFDFERLFALNCGFHRGHRVNYLSQAMDMNFTLTEVAT